MQPIEVKKKNSTLPSLSGFPQSHLLAALALGSLLTLVMSFFPSKDVAAVRQGQPLTLPLPLKDALEQVESIEQEQTISAPLPTARINWQEVSVRPGDNLSLLFQRVGLGPRDVHELLNTCKAARSLNHIYPGHRLAFQINEQGQLQRLRYSKDKLHSQMFSRTQTEGLTRFISQMEIREPDVKLAYRTATINNSLFLAGEQVQLDHNLIMELANIFGWDIDFALDIRQGDHFEVLFEERFLDGEKIGNGAILASSFTNKGKTYRAVRYTNTAGTSHYYTPDGHSMRKEFIRTPVDWARISSHFNLRRKHPILNRIRAHKGTDYAAPRGTPVKAAGDGKVIFAGRKGGYGNTVIIQHGQTYKTLYAHLHKFRRSVRRGARVQQGQIIGYVGSTGLATGPHLHYEFYVNGAVRNPVTVKLPKANAIAKAERASFMTQTQPFIAQLDQYRQDLQLALASSTETSIN